LYYILLYDDDTDHVGAVREAGWHSAQHVRDNEAMGGLVTWSTGSRCWQVILVACRWRQETTCQRAGADRSWSPRGRLHPQPYDVKTHVRNRV